MNFENILFILQFFNIKIVNFWTFLLQGGFPIEINIEIRAQSPILIRYHNHYYFRYHRWKTVERRQGTNKHGPVLEVVPKVPEWMICQQHPVLPYGHPSKHWRSSLLLNLGDRLVSGPFNPIRTLANNWGLKSHFEFHINIFNFNGSKFYSNGD